MTEVVQDGDERRSRQLRRRRIIVIVGCAILFVGAIVGAVNPGNGGHPGQQQAKAACDQLLNLADGVAHADLALTDANAAANTSAHYTDFFTATQHLQAADSSGDATQFSNADRSALESVCGHQLADVPGILHDRGVAVASTNYLRLSTQLDPAGAAALRKVITDSTALAAAQRANPSGNAAITAQQAAFEADLGLLGQDVQTASTALASEDLLLTYWRADAEAAALAIGRVQGDCVSAAGAGPNTQVLNTHLAQFAADLTAERAAVGTLRRDLGVAPLSLGFL
jgi:hypothetical protein